MTRTTLILSGMLLASGLAAGQVSPPTAATYSPYQSRMAAAAPFAPNFYNRQNQPLSPYMNLFRGADPVTNYYYGVRPGLPSGNALATGPATPPPMAAQARVGFLPAAANPSQEPTVLPAGGDKIESLPPASHPVVFGAGSAQYLRGGAGGSPRPGMIGNKPPAPLGGRKK